MIHMNERTLKEMAAANYREFGVNGLIEKIKELESRLDALETKPKVGRPRKVG